MNKLTELQKVIDDFWQSYSNPLAFDKPVIKIVDVFDNVAKSFLFLQVETEEICTE